MLFNQIKNEQILARKQKAQVATALLTTLLGEAQIQAKNKGVEVLGDQDVVSLVKKFLKGNQEFLDSPNLDEHKRVDLITEKEILTRYLPLQLSDVQIRDTIREMFRNGVNKKGDVMKGLKERYNGMYDGKRASELFSEVEKES